MRARHRLLRASRFAWLFALTACSHASSSGGPIDAGEPDALAPIPDAAIADATVDQEAPTRVRIVAANTTSGSSQSYDLPGIRIFQGLAPDIVLIQEFNYAGNDRRALVDAAFGKDFSFYVEPRAGGIPNGIVSRYPILESGVWADASTPDRAFAYARIDVPGAIDLWAVSVHLLTSGSSQRSTEAAQLLGYIKSTVPATAYLVVGGDFNTDTAGEQALLTLSAALTVSAPFPADQNGNANTSINRNHPHDFVFAGSSLDAKKTPVTIGAVNFGAGLVFDSRVYTPLMDVAPVLVTDSAATGMQHMPVVRDFVLGGPS